jgi:NACalpha-BTF3-like transcription factor
MEIQEALEASKSDQNQPSSSSSKQPEAQINPKVTQVMNMTKCTKQKAEEALAKFNNDPNAAALSLLTSGL